MRCLISRCRSQSGFSRLLMKSKLTKNLIDYHKIRRLVTETKCNVMVSKEIKTPKDEIVLGISIIY